MSFMKRFYFVLAALLLVSLAASAQTTSNLTGTVSLGGTPLPGATVTISSPSLQGQRTTISDVNGNYNFGALPPGDYTVKFEMESMQSVPRPVKVGLGQTGRANASMQLTSVAEAITVTAASPATLETTEVQTNISAKTVNELPVPRNVLATANLAPGVNTNTTVGGQVIISGAPAHENSYIVDGAVVNENLRGQFSNLFIEDALQETTVLTGGISAEYGRFTGGCTACPARILTILTIAGCAIAGTPTTLCWGSPDRKPTPRRSNSVSPCSCVMNSNWSCRRRRRW